MSRTATGHLRNWRYSEAGEKRSIWGQGISLFVRGDQGTGTQCVVKGLTVDMSAGFCGGGGAVGGGGGY